MYINNLHNTMNMMLLYIPILYANSYIITLFYLSPQCPSVCFKMKHDDDDDGQLFAEPFQ